MSLPKVTIPALCDLLTCWYIDDANAWANVQVAATYPKRTAGYCDGKVLNLLLDPPTFAASILCRSLAALYIRTLLGY